MTDNNHYLVTKHRWLITIMIMTLLSPVSIFAGRYYQLGDCGSSWAQRLGIRDSWGNASFAPACRAHDKCYETCMKDKRDCDNAFKSTMRQACKDAYPWWGHAHLKEACLKIADGYHSAVHRNGGDAYRAAQKECVIEKVQIVNDHYKKCLNLQEHQNFDNGQVNIWTCADHPDQDWKIESVGGGFVRVINTHYNKCLNLQADQKKNGGLPKVFTCTNHPDQAWKLEKFGNAYRLVNQAHGMCLNLQQPQAHDTGTPNVWQCADHPDQAWLLNQVDVYYCDAGYKKYQGQCKKITCEGNRVAGENWSKKITNGTKRYYCTNNGIQTSVSCISGYQYDGYGCYKYIP